MVVDLISLGGQLVLDDLTAEAEWKGRGRADPKRKAWPSGILSS